MKEILILAFHQNYMDLVNSYKNLERTFNIKKEREIKLLLTCSLCQLFYDNHK